MPQWGGGTRMRNPKLEILKYQPLAQVGSPLRGRKKQILYAWRKKVMEVLPHADELTLSQLHNSVPQLIEQIADALEAADPGPTAELMRSSPDHGATRFDQNFKLNELLIEYHLLRGTVFENLSKALGRELTTVEAMGVNSSIDVALRRAAVAFAAQQVQDLKAQTEATAKYLSFLSHDIRGNLNAALLMAEALPGDHRVTLGADKGYDDHDFVAELRHMEITPHIAQNDTNRRSSVDDRTTRHAGYQLSQKKRKRIEEVFGWMKSIGLLRKVRHRGLERVGWIFTFTAAAYNLVRIRNLMRGTPQSQCA